MRFNKTSGQFLSKPGRNLAPFVFCLLFFYCLLPGLANVDTAAKHVPEIKEPPVNLKPIEDVCNTWLKRPELQHSLVGLEIMHIPSAQILFSFNGRKRFTPASSAKVYGTACAMDTLGPNFVYNTRLKAYGKIEGDTLNGSLYIEPSQDPTLETEDLRKLLSVLGKKGIKNIEGKVDIAGVPGGGDRFSAAWLLEDWGQDWMPVPSDLVLDGNIARRDPARGYPLVSISGSRDQNALVSSALTSPDGPAWVSFNPSNRTMQFWHPNGPAVGGQIVGNPGEYNLAAVMSILKTMGIKVKEKPIAIKVMEEAPAILAEHHSDPLSVIIKYCLKESDNLYAQQILRTLGSLPAVSKSVEKSSLEERGLSRINQWLLAIGVTPGEVLLWDGCGLSRKDCFTPHALNLVHRHMAGASLKSAYLDVMPADNSENKSSGFFRYKTGTMDCVRTISGVLTTAAGEPLAVTVMVNAHNPSIRDVRASMNGMLAGLEALPSLRLPSAPVSPAVATQKTPEQARAVAHPAGRKRHKRHRH